MKIFVTGASGFIGREFCRLALSRGHELLGLQRDTRIKLIDGCQSAPGSLSDPPWDIIEAFRPDTVLHLAWITTPGLYLESPENEILAEQSAALFCGLIASGVQHIAGTGTCIEYAPSCSHLDENTSALASSFGYSRAKIETSRKLENISLEARTSWSWLRLFYPYGAGEHPRRMPSSLIRKLTAGDTVELKTPDSVKDYIHVTDAAEAILTVLEHQLTGPVNIGTGTGIRILELANAIAQVCGIDKKMIKSAHPPAADPFPFTVAGTKKLQGAGWRPAVELNTGLESLRQSLC